MGLFDNCGLILGIAGPSGTMLSYGLVSVGVICVMEGISEMVGHWPVSNAMVEFVRSFVDEELSWVVGIAYWYTLVRLESFVCIKANEYRAANSISFATLIVAASNLAAYYDWPKYYQVSVFVVLLPVALLILNCLGVKV
jgi:yeast amino acid transporter